MNGPCHQTIMILNAIRLRVKVLMKVEVNVVVAKLWVERVGCVIGLFEKEAELVSSRILILLCLA